MIRVADPRASHELLEEELDTATAEFFASGQYILGDGVRAFEEAFAAYCGVAHCVGVASGLDALVLGLLAGGVKQGDEVIVPSNTYIATWLAVTHVGAVPVPVEPHADTYNLDPGLVQAAVTPRTRAILPVHLYGNPADVVGLRALADEHGLFVLEDAAQAHGARLGGTRTGAMGHAAGFSFYPTKNLGAFGDGGAVTTSDPEVARQVRLLRNYGSPRRYVNDIVGYNSRLDELQARLLSVKLAHLDAWNAVRARQAAIYLDVLSSVDGLVLPSVEQGAEHAWHLFVVRSRRRDALARHLEAQGIETLVHYPIAPHLQAAYAPLGFGPGSFPISEEIHETVLSLPLGPHLSQNDQDRVLSGVVSFAG